MSCVAKLTASYVSARTFSPLTSAMARACEPLATPIDDHARYAKTTRPPSKSHQLRGLASPPPKSQRQVHDAQSCNVNAARCARAHNMRSCRSFILTTYHTDRLMRQIYDPFEGAGVFNSKVRANASNLNEQNNLPLPIALANQQSDDVDKWT